MQRTSTPAACNPLRIASAIISNHESPVLKITLEGQGCCDPDVRLHVLATHFVPAENFSLANPLVTPLDPHARGQRGVVWKRPVSYFLSNRVLGDEYCYILDRKTRAQHARAGVMLERSGLLLNPWDVRKTTTNTQLAQSGSSWSTANYEECESFVDAAPPKCAAPMRQARMKNMRGRMMRKEAVSWGNVEESYNSNRNMARSSPRMSILLPTCSFCRSLHFLGKSDHGW